MDKYINGAIAVIFVALSIVLGMLFIAQTLPTVATALSTSAGSTLANAGVVTNSLPGLVASFAIVIYSLLLIVIPAAGVTAVYLAFRGGGGLGGHR